MKPDFLFADDNFTLVETMEDFGAGQDRFTFSGIKDFEALQAYLKGHKEAQPGAVALIGMGVFRKMGILQAQELTWALSFLKDHRFTVAIFDSIIGDEAETVSRAMHIPLFERNALAFISKSEGFDSFEANTVFEASWHHQGPTLLEH